MKKLIVVVSLLAGMSSHVIAESKQLSEKELSNLYSSVEYFNRWKSTYNKLSSTVEEKCYEKTLGRSKLNIKCRNSIWLANGITKDDYETYFESMNIWAKYINYVETEWINGEKKYIVIYPNERK